MKDVCPWCGIGRQTRGQGGNPNHYKCHSMKLWQSIKCQLSCSEKRAEEWKVMAETLMDRLRDWKSAEPGMWDTLDGEAQLDYYKLKAKDKEQGYE